MDHRAAHPTIAKLAADDGPLQMSLFDQQIWPRSLTPYGELCRLLADFAAHLPAMVPAAPEKLLAQSCPLAAGRYRPT